MEREDEETRGRPLFQVGLGVRGGRKHEGVGSLMEEKDLGPKTRETELRLALPGGDWHGGRRQTYLLEHYPCDNHSKSTTNSVGVKRMFSDTVVGIPTKEGRIHNLVFWSSSTPPSLTVLPSNHQTALLQLEQKTGAPSILKEPPPMVAQPELKNTDMAASEQRVVVGWPPLRSFRKNFASSSSKPSGEIESSGASLNERKAQSCKIGLFVKIHMDGVPIGRKIDLGAYDSYEKLSLAVDELFRALLAAQREHEFS